MQRIYHSRGQYWTYVGDIPQQGQYLVICRGYILVSGNTRHMWGIYHNRCNTWPYIQGLYYSRRHVGLLSYVGLSSQQAAILGYMQGIYHSRRQCFAYVGVISQYGSFFGHMKEIRHRGYIIIGAILGHIYIYIYIWPSIAPIMIYPL